MSLLRVDQYPPTDFLRLLYEDEEGEDDLSELEMESEDEVDDNENRSPTLEAPPYSPLSSPPHRGDRERSRSPIRLHQSEPMVVVVRIFDEAGVALDEEDFLTPDAHPIFNFDSVNVVNDASERRRNGRRGMRDIRGRGRRARGRAFSHRSRRGGFQWEVGHPLKEIWTTDEDVPPELISLARDVVRRREEVGMQDREKDDDEVFDASDAQDRLLGLEGQNRQAYFD
ncbi:hypothetical protein evm_009248 [Chilo suppressalis]|nr:hypothetical protein evm_009248 [Chilo suppressalis]